MTYVEFYTKKYHFVITEQGVFKNGEWIAKGKVSFFHLILDEDAWLVVKSGEYCPDTIIKTDRVYSILPENEYYCGEKFEKRHIFRTSFQIFIQDKWVECIRNISAANEAHLSEIIEREFGCHVKEIRIEQILDNNSIKVAN